MMNKFFNYAFIGAIALTGATMFAGCSSTDDATAEDTSNPNYNPQTKEVTTQFVLNVAANTADNITRQSATTVQKNQNFRGIQDAKLIALSTGNSTWLAPFAGGATAGLTVNKTFELGTLYGTTAVDNTGATNSESSSRRVLELSMPLTTDAMLVYGRAIPSGDAEVDGAVTMNVAAAPENSTFSLTPRLSTAREQEYEQTCALAIKILNRIVDSELGTAGIGSYTLSGYTNVAELPVISWKGLGAAVAGGTLSPLEEILGRAFNTLTTINTNEYRAGSSYAISSIAHYIYSTASTVYNATATSDAELNAQRLASEIRRRIQNYFEKYDQDESQIAFLNLSEIKAHMIEATTMTEAVWDAAYGQVAHGDLKAFPTSFGLPLGVALLNYDATNGFTHRNVPTSLLDKNATLAENRYMYPAELLYFDNSALRLHNVTQKVTDYPNGYTPWDTEASWTAKGWTSGAVNSSTRSVAVKNNINYGVAMLKTIVTLDGSVTEFEDNRHGIVPTEENQKLTANQVKQFQLVGVLVGGQNHQVGWNYLPKNTDSDEWSYVVYDNKVVNGAIPTPSGEETYTLVFDNYYPNTTQTDEVLIALEFKNNGNDFYGLGNMIRAGGTFYLVGKLSLSSATMPATFAWPTTYAIPPYTTAGASEEVKRVFIQDFMTTATFKIGANSLKNAYVTVPDLRSSQTSLGLSVNLEWRPGLEFTTTLGQ